VSFAACTATTTPGTPRKETLIFQKAYYQTGLCRPHVQMPGAVQVNNVSPPRRNGG
jgi:hypothetical protein